MRQTDGRTKGREAVRKAAYLWAGTQCANQKQDRMTLTSKELIAIAKRSRVSCAHNTSRAYRPIVLDLEIDVRGH